MHTMVGAHTLASISNQVISVQQLHWYTVSFVHSCCVHFFALLLVTIVQQQSSTQLSVLAKQLPLCSLTLVARGLVSSSRAAKLSNTSTDLQTFSLQSCTRKPTDSDKKPIFITTTTTSTEGLDNSQKQGANQEHK